MSPCLFCRIVEGEVPVDVVMRTPEVIAFRDVAPQSPVHILVIPTTHYPDVAAMAAQDPRVAGLVLAAVGSIAESQGLEDGYRLTFNTGLAGGQTVFHVHAHLMGGRQMTWPPG